MMKLGYKGYGVQGLHCFRRLLLYSSTLSSPEPPSSFVSYLVHSLGFSHQQSLLTSTKLTQTRQAQGATKASDFNFIHNADNVIHFFNHFGLDHSRIRRIVCSYPKILLSDVDKTLKPKIELLQELGLSALDLFLILSRNYFLLHRSLDSFIKPAVKTLREVLVNDDDVIKFLQKSWQSSKIYYIPIHLVDNFNLLLNYGIPVDLIRKRFLMLHGLLRPKQQLEDLLLRVEEGLGIPRHSRMFLYGVQLLASRSERNIESKYEVFKSFGWAQSDIKALIRSNPYSLVGSKARIKKSLDFLMGELGYKPAYLAANNFLLTCSLEKRIVPRHRIMLVLKEKGLIRKEYALTTITKMVEPKFLEKFVLPFKEVHEVYSEYNGRPVQLLTQGRANSHSQR